MLANRKHFDLWLGMHKIDVFLLDNMYKIRDILRIVCPWAEVCLIAFVSMDGKLVTISTDKSIFQFTRIVIAQAPDEIDRWRPTAACDKDGLFDHTNQV